MQNRYDGPNNGWAQLTADLKKAVDADNLKAAQDRRHVARLKRAKRHMHKWSTRYEG